MTLGEKIQELRRSRGMSQDELAEKLEISRQAVSKWERDEAVPETEKIIRIAQVFGVTTDYLLLEDRRAPPTEPWIRRPYRASAWDWIEVFIRRHGYKAGYGLMAWGAVLCVIALLAAIFVPMIGSAFTENSGSSIHWGSSWSSSDLKNQFDQQVAQMNQTWLSSVRLITALFAVPVLLIGIGLIVAGVIIIRKGKRMAPEQ